MYQRNRNLFSFLAVLLTAGVITGIGGLFFYLSDRLGGAPRLASEETDVIQPTIAFPGAAPSLASTAAEVDLAVSESPENDPTVNLSAVAKTIGTHSAAVLSVAIAPDNSILASGSYDNTVKLWSRNSSAAPRILSHDGPVNDLAFTPDGEYLIAGTDSGNVEVWNLFSLQLASTLEGNAGRINSVATDNSRQHIASGSSNGALKVWSIAGEVYPPPAPTVLANLGSQVNALVFHPIDENLLISGHQAGVIQIWDIAQNKSVQTLEAGANQIVSVDVSPDGQYIAAGSYDRVIRIWKMNTGELVQTLKGHSAVVAKVTFSPDSRLLASGSYDESIKIWNWPIAQVKCTLEGKAGFVYDLAFADDGGTLTSGSYDGAVDIWDLTTGGSCLAS